MECGLYAKMKWSELSPMQTGRYAGDYAKMKFIEIKKQVRKVIELLEQRIILEPNRPILKTLYDMRVKRYSVKDAL